MKVNSKQISETIVKQLVSGVREKKELSGIMGSLVREEIHDFLKRNNKALNYFSSLDSCENLKKSKHYREAIKKTREKLRKSTGVFLLPVKKTEPEQLLRKHESTRERLKIYPELYQRIFHITGNPGTILDIGCGLNPLSYSFLGAKPEYYAYDANSFVIEIIKEFFMKKNVKGEAGLLNIREAKTRNLKLPKADICFLFKVLDSIETEKGHKLAEKLIKQLPCKWIIASFSTKTLSGKRMNHPYRGWVEQMCRRLEYFYEPIEYENEVFYLIRKR